MISTAHFVKSLFIFTLAMGVTSESTISTPRFEGIMVKDENDETINIQEYIQEGLVLMYFYPKANTPGCTKQGCSLRDSWSELSKYNLKVLAVSKDNPKPLANFKNKYEFPFKMISDPNKQLGEALGFDTGPFGYPRKAFLFRDGKLEWKQEKAPTTKQAESVLEYLSSKEG